MKFFRFVICSLVIYGCFEGHVAKIEADNAALEEKTNKVGGEGNRIVILDEEFPDEPNVEVRTKRETDGGKEKYSGYNGDDEDGEKETDGLGSGDEEEYMQSDEPSSPIDENAENLNAQGNSSSRQKLTGTSSATRAIGQTVSVNASATVAFVTNASSGNSTINIAPTTRSDGNSSNTVVTNPLYSTPYMRAVNTIDTVTAMTVESSPLFSSLVKASKTFRVVVSRSTFVNLTGLATEQSKTIEPTTKDDGDVLNQKDPPPEENEGRETLFGFVTIEILVALLAGAACAVILLVFLVHRLKKRNEGSYELQEMLNLKTAGYAEEKEVFV